MSPFDPFGTLAPDEVPLPRAPLVRVIAQLRFPTIVSLGDPNFVGPFQEAIRARYPILRPEQTAGLVVGPMGVVVQKGEATVWRFHDKADAWRVSLGTDFIALETTAYENRDDFFARFGEAVRALDDLVKLSVFDRLGVRYVNRIHGPELDRLSALVRPEVLGVGTGLATGLRHSLCESLFLNDEVALSTRWGSLPADTTTDPSMLDPIPHPSWILDLDMFLASQRDFNVETVVGKGRAFAASIYGFFRWCVQPELLTTYGGKP